MQLANAQVERDLLALPVLLNLFKSNLVLKLKNITYKFANRVLQDRSH